MHWASSARNDPRALPVADRHYNRQKPGSPQFVQPGRCLVLLTADASALWVTSAPYAQYVRHHWAGAWVNSLFRNESNIRASVLILEAIAVSRCRLGEPPKKGIVSFVDPHHVRPTLRHGRKLYGYCYLKAGFKQVGLTRAGLWVWQMLPADMPAPKTPLSRRYS